MTAGTLNFSMAMGHDLLSNKKVVKSGPSASRIAPSKIPADTGKYPITQFELNSRLHKMVPRNKKKIREVLLAWGICTGGCLARCFGGSMRCRCRAGSTPIAVAKSGAEGGGSEQCPRTRLRGSKWGSSDAKNEPSGSADLARACSDGKFIVYRSGGAYDARDRGPIRKSRVKPSVLDHGIP